MPSTKETSDICFKCRSYCCKGEFAIGVGITGQEAERLENLRSLTGYKKPIRTPMMYFDHDGVCPFLKNNRCLFYNNRPRICRGFRCAQIGAE